MAIMLWSVVNKPCMLSVVALIVILSVKALEGKHRSVYIFPQGVRKSPRYCSNNFAS